MICSSVNRLRRIAGPPRGHPKPNPHHPRGGVFAEHVVPSLAGPASAGLGAGCAPGSGQTFHGGSQDVLEEGGALALDQARTILPSGLPGRSDLGSLGLVLFRGHCLQIPARVPVVMPQRGPILLSVSGAQN